MKVYLLNILIFLGFLASAVHAQNSSHETSLPNQNNSKIQLGLKPRPVIKLDEELLGDGKGAQDITPMVGMKKIVSNQKLPKESDLHHLIYEKSELQIDYTNDPHGLIMDFDSLPLALQSKDLVVTINHSLAGVVEVFRREGLGPWKLVGKSGSEIVFDKRLIPGFELAFPLELSSSQKVSYLLRKTSKHRFDAKVEVMGRELYDQKQSTLKNYYFFYWGAFVALLVYNTFLFVASGEKNYLFYLIFGMAIHVTVLAMTGFLDYLMAPLGMTGGQNLILFSSTSLMTSMYFAYRYNNLGVFTPRGVKVMLVIGAITLFIFLASLGPWDKFFGGAKLGTLIDIMLPSGILMMIGTAFVALRKGHTLARFYLTSWLFMFVGALMYFAHYTSLIPRNFLTSHGVMWGNLLEMLIVSWGLAYKVSILDREKKEAFILAQGKREYERLVRVLLHDIANPLNLIQHYTDMKASKPEMFEKREDKAWSKINFGVSKIREIITFHREQEMNISHNYRSIGLAEVSLQKVLEQCSQMFEEVLDKKNVKLVIETGRDFVVMAEKVSLVNEVLSNIISNAIKFSFEGERVRITSEDKGKFVHLKIRDYGRGMAPDNLMAFNENRGIQSRPGTQGETGTGYGLYLVKSYMELYNGQVIVESRQMDEANPSDTKIHGTTVTLVFKKA